MAYKDLLLLLGDRGDSAPELDLALALAQRFEAHLTGLSLHAEAALPGYVVAYMTVAMLAEQRATQAVNRAAARDGFEAACARAGVIGEWRDASVLPGGETDLAEQHARYADLVILGQPDPDAGSDERRLAEDMLVRCGRPVLLVPFIGARAAVGQRILVAWDGGREAARAVADALPLLKAAERVEVVTVDATIGATGHGEEPGADIARHLARHGVAVEVAQLKSGTLAVGDLLLNRVADSGFDLIVMGAYAHSRLRDLVLGGVTRHMLKHMTVPILTAH